VPTSLSAEEDGCALKKISRSHLSLRRRAIEEFANIRSPENQRFGYYATTKARGHSSAIAGSNQDPAESYRSGNHSDHRQKDTAQDRIRTTADRSAQTLNGLVERPYGFKKRITCVNKWASVT